MKPFWKSRTMWLSLATAVLGAVELYGAGLSALLGPKAMGITMLVVGVANAVLRAVTREAISAS